MRIANEHRVSCGTVQSIAKAVHTAQAAAWFARQKPLADEQVAKLVLQTVYEGDASTPHRDAWAAEIGIPFARAIEREHGIKA